MQEVTAREALLDRAAALAERIAAQAPLGVAATLAKRTPRASGGDAVAARALRGEITKLMASDDAREGLQSFLERRAGRFAGK